MHRVFVYGTLKQGYGNYEHYLKGRSIFMGHASTVEDYRMLDGGFPVVRETNDALPDKLNGCVSGEVYLVNDATLRDLNSLEGVREQGQGMYDKKTVTVRMPFMNTPGMDFMVRREVSMYVGCAKSWDGRGSQMMSGGHIMPNVDGELVWHRGGKKPAAPVKTRTVRVTLDVEVSEVKNEYSTAVDALTENDADEVSWTFEDMYTNELFAGTNLFLNVEKVKAVSAEWQS